MKGGFPIGRKRWPIRGHGLGLTRTCPAPGRVDRSLPMRSTTHSLTLGLVLGTLLVFGAQVFVTGAAHGEEEAAPEAKEGKEGEVKGLRAQVAALQKQVEYLRSREDAITTYLIANDVRAESLQDHLKKARTQGFLNRSIPADSRTSLLDGLDGLAESMRADLPKRSKAEERMRKEADGKTKLAGAAE